MYEIKFLKRKETKSILESEYYEIKFTSERDKIKFAEEALQNQVRPPAASGVSRPFTSLRKSAAF